jgi:hypothetical protein
MDVACVQSRNRTSLELSQEAATPSARKMPCVRLIGVLLCCMGIVDARLPVYFGNGCFWARQHTFVTELEETLLNRSAEECRNGD